MAEFNENISPFELLRISTEAQQAFVVAGFSDPCKAHFKAYMDDLQSAQLSLQDVGILNEMAVLKEAILDNFDSPHVMRQSLITETRMFIHISPFMKAKVEGGNLGDLPHPHQWAKSLEERGAFKTAKERKNGTL